MDTASEFGLQYISKLTSFINRKMQHSDTISEFILQSKNSAAKWDYRALAA